MTATMPSVVEVRLCHLPGRDDLAVVRAAAPAVQGAPLCAGEELRDVGPRLRECVDAGELSALAIVLQGQDSEVRAVSPEDVAALVASLGLPLILVLDGVHGALVDALAAVADRIVRGAAQTRPAPYGPDVPAAETREVTGAELVDDLVAEIRAQGVPALS